MRRLAVLVVVCGALLGTLIVTAFGEATPRVAPDTLPAPSRSLASSGPPTPMTVALRGALRIQLPISQGRVTAIGYHSSGDSALGLTPLGRQGNEGALARLAHKIFGGGHGSFVYYQLSGGETAVLDVGAAPGTDVYAPVDGTVLAIGDVVLNGRIYGSRIDIQPAGAPSLILSVSHVRVDPSLVVGSPVTAGGSKLGSIVDFSGAEKQSLARYTNDTGNHVVIEVHRAAIPALG